MYFLGINLDSHDTGAAIIKADGGAVDVFAVAEERLNRSKRTLRFPVLSIASAMDHFGISSFSEIDAACIVNEQEDLPVAHFSNKYLRLALDGRSYGDIRYSEWIRLSSLLLNNIIPVFANHLDCHAHSAFWPSPFDEAAALIIDGSGIGIYLCNNNEISVIDRYGYYGTCYNNARALPERLCWKKVPTIGAVYYHASRTKLKFGSEGTLMGLAAYPNETGEPQPFHHRTAERLYDFVRLNTGYISELDDYVQQRKDLIPVGDRSHADAYRVAMARGCQELLEEEVLHLATLAKEKTGLRNLVIAGGVGLSCVCNRKILDAGLFDEIFIQPGASDEGLALGAALHAYHTLDENRPRWRMTNAYLGPGNPRDDAERLLSRFGFTFRRAALSEVARDIADGKVVGWVNGRSEYGPRALGARSILADPRRAEMRDYINTHIKDRELFRPFAPSVLDDRREEYFVDQRSSPFMIIMSYVKDEWIDRIPAISHVDKTARPQTVTRKDNPDYYDLIDEFGKLTGIYLVLNTSFNGRSEPIVQTYLDALHDFCKINLDALFLDGWYLERAAHSEDVLSRARQIIGKEIDEHLASAYDRALARLDFRKTGLPDIDDLSAKSGAMASDESGGRAFAVIRRVFNLAVHGRLSHADLVRVVRTLMGAENHDLVVQLYQAWLANTRSPLAHIVHADLGEVLRGQGRESEALEAFRSSLAIDPGYERAKVLLSTVEERVGPA